MNGIANQQVKRLADLAQIERDGIAPELIKTGTVYVGLENITSEGAFSGVGPVDAGQLASTKFTFTSKHLLYGKLRPYLRKIARPHFDGICSTDILPILPSAEIDRNYLFHFLRQDVMVAKANLLTAGANLPRLSPKSLAEFPIPVLPLAEQQRIAAILDKAESLRVKRRQALAKLDTLTRSLFLDLFGDPRTNPKGWNKTTVGDIAPFISSGVTPLGGSSVYQTTGILFIRSQNVLMNAVDFSDAAFVSTELHRQMKRSWVKNGDVLLNITGASIGRVHYFSGEDDSANVNQHVCIIRVDQNRIRPAFLSRFLSAPSYQAQIVGQNSGATRQAFNFEQIRRFDIFLPPMELQAKFARQEALVAGLRVKYTTSLTKLDALFASLQHRAFQGEL
ncbi:MAG: restriction endonuclease subunit S [Verrucomicrobia bacterium]|nr:restriction endonuclease subunit S [Verrucomicrobiota bacterium]